MIQKEVNFNTVCPDCCEFLTFNEEEQALVLKMSGNRHPHYCTKYSERLKHFPNSKPYITKCRKCQEDKINN